MTQIKIQDIVNVIFLKVTMKEDIAEINELSSIIFRVVEPGET